MSNLRYNTSREALHSMEIKLQYISTSKYEGDWHSSLHAHQCAELFFVVSGQGSFNVQGDSFPVETNDMVIINPHVQHTETAAHNSPMEYIVLGITGGDFLAAGAEDYRFCIFNCASISEELLFYMHKILSEMEEAQPYHSTAAQSLLTMLAIKLQRHKHLTLRARPVQDTGSDSARVKQYIDNNFKQDINLDTLAKVAHLNKFYLVHTFTKENGLSPIAYLILKRIEESRYLLAGTDYSVTQISQILGFSSPSYFSQCFSKAEKTSPSKYRKRQALKQEKEPKTQAPK